MVENQNAFYNNSQQSSSHFHLDNISSEDLLAAEEALSLNFSPTAFINQDSPMDFHSQDGHSQDIKPECVHPAQYESFHAPQMMVMYPDHHKQLPILEDTETPWNFEINLHGDHSGKTSWMYSSKLNKVFVKINSYINVYPNYEVQHHGEELFVRTMIVYTQKNDIQEPVTKCPNHRSQNDSQEFPEHILRCNTQETAYIGTEKGRLFHEKLAIKVPMRNVAKNGPIQLIFTCQNSCSGGMNRRSTSLIFILENAAGVMYGRRVLHFKVCSCPKRDKDKEEDISEASKIKFMPKKRKLDPESSKPSNSVAVMAADTATQQVKTETVEENPCEIRMLLPNAEIKKKVLDYAHDILAGEMHRNREVNYDKFIDDLKSQMGELEM